MKRLFATGIFLLLACSMTYAQPEHTPGEQYSELINQWMDSYLAAAQSGDAEAFHRQMSAASQAKYPLEDIQVVFSQMVDIAPVLRKALSQLDPVVTASEVQPEEKLTLMGYYFTYPSVSFFELIFEWEESRWRPSGVALRFRPLVVETVIRSNSGWNVSLQSILEGYDILYRVPGETEYRSSRMDNNHSRSEGFPSVSQIFDELPEAILVKLVTPQGGVTESMEISLDARSSLAKQAMLSLDMSKENWLILRGHMGRELLYFTMLVTNRCGINEVRYSLGSEVLDRTLELPPCDPEANPFYISSDMPTYLELDRRYEYIAVQLTFYDGSQSEVIRIPHR